MRDGTFESRRSDDETLLVFGGPYSNLEATRAVLAEAARRGIEPRQVVCTGDVVAYAADPIETVDLVRRAGIRVIMGNCEESLAARAEDCGCGFDPESACAALSAAWYAFADARLDGEARRWMRDLPRRIDLTLAGRRLAFVHGGAGEINKFVFASAADDELAAEIDRTGCEGVVAGHCGIPFTRLVGRRLWHNAGAVGMPANDGTPRAWYSLLSLEPGGIRIEHRALDYDWSVAAAKMRRAGLPEGYAAALGSGLWPSRDVLPGAERRRTGVPLDEVALTWCDEPAVAGVCEI